MFMQKVNHQSSNPQNSIQKNIEDRGVSYEKTNKTTNIR